MLLYRSLLRPCPSGCSRTRGLSRQGAAGLVTAGVLIVSLAAPVSPQTSTGPEGSGKALLVLAAASLADVLPPLAGRWEERSGVPVRFSFAATSRLAPQLEAGVPADVFISADLEWMDWAEERGAIRRETRTPIASNRLVLAVPAQPGTRAVEPDEVIERVTLLALADEHVPAGRYARQALESEGVWTEVESRVVRGGSVRGTLEWIARGEVEAGVVYRTDAAAEPRVEAVREFSPGSHDAIVYSGAVTVGSTSPEEAGRFLAFLADPEGRAVLSAAGFMAPPDPSASSQGMAGSFPDPLSAIRLSVIVAFVATLVGLVPAVGLGWLLARREFRGKSVVATLVLAPLVLPPVVTGFILLSLLGLRSLLGGWLAALGVQVPFTLVGASLAAMVVGLPLYVMAIRGAFEAVDTRFEEVSWTLGVHRSATFRRVTLPLAIPGIAAGAVLAFARSLGEFGATIVLAGNVEGSTRTIALAVYSLLESPSGHAATWTLVGASVVISLGALLGFEALSRRQKARLEDHRG